MPSINPSSASRSKKTIQLYIQEYFNECESLTEDELVTKYFWKNHQKIWPELASFAKMILTIPATSAPVERIFSVGGAILRPSRRRLLDKLFKMQFSYF